MLRSVNDPASERRDTWLAGPPAAGGTDAAGFDTRPAYDARPDTGPSPGPGPGAGGGPDIVWALRLARVVVLFVYLVVAASLAILALGFVMRLFGASTDADFTEWVYRNVERIMEPFRGMFPTEPLNDRSVVDFSLLFAMMVYGIAAVALHALVSWLAGHIVAIGRRQDRARRFTPGG
jgi:uncharacterized protein YggT (Ycf19 family)